MVFLFFSDVDMIDDGMIQCTIVRDDGIHSAG